ncbi:MAG: hypothetical protein FJX23_01575 [Alphaproteobacteria bacterium]|nr:hypothetical protein [Alphaproteobacteria bacterium]
MRFLSSAGVFLGIILFNLSSFAMPSGAPKPWLLMTVEEKKSQEEQHQVNQKYFPVVPVGKKASSPSSPRISGGDTDAEMQKSYEINARIFNLINTIAIAEYTGDYREIRPSMPLGVGSVPNYTFVPISFIKGKPVDVLNVQVSKYFEQPSDKSLLFKKGRRYLLLMQTVGFPKPPSSQSELLQWSNLSYPHHAILLEE